MACVLFCYCSCVLLLVCQLGVGGKTSANRQPVVEGASMPGHQRVSSDRSAGSSSDNNTECFVEVRQTRSIPGRCLSTGSIANMPHLCQTLDRTHIAVSSVCAAVADFKSGN